MPRGHLLCYSPLQFIFSGAHDCLRQLSPKTVNKKSVSAESASLKIVCTTLKVRNLPYVLATFKTRHYNGFKQTDFLRFVPPIFLTLTSQGGNQGIAQGNGFKRSPKSVFAGIRDRQRLIIRDNKSPDIYKIVAFLCCQHNTIPSRCMFL